MTFLCIVRKFLQRTIKHVLLFYIHDNEIPCDRRLDKTKREQKRLQMLSEEKKE